MTIFPKNNSFKKSNVLQESMNYGELLSKHTDKSIIYKAFADYFKNPTMTKIKNINGFSMYLTKLHCLLSTQKRYIIVFIPQDINLIRHTEKLSLLKWKSIQTRTLTDHYDLPKHIHVPTSKTPLKQSINLVKRSDECSVYHSDSFPLEITLLHDKKGSFDYQKKGTIIAALETYQTLIQWQSI